MKKTKYISALLTLSLIVGNQVYGEGQTIQIPSAPSTEIKEPEPQSPEEKKLDDFNKEIGVSEELKRGWISGIFNKIKENIKNNIVFLVKKSADIFPGGAPTAAKLWEKYGWRAVPVLTTWLYDQYGRLFSPEEIGQIMGDKQYWETFYIPSLSGEQAILGSPTLPTYMSLAKTAADKIASYL